MNPWRIEAMKKLLVLTQDFPYGTAEPFLEVELPILCRHFSEVIVFPVRAGYSYRKRGPARIVPENCRVVAAALSAGSLLGAMPVAWTLRGLADRSRLKGVGRLQLEEWIGRWCARAALTVRSLLRLQKSEGALPFGYSYWKLEAADALAYLKRNGRIPGFITRCHRGDLYDDCLEISRRPLDRLMRSQVDRIVAVSTTD